MNVKQAFAQQSLPERNLQQINLLSRYFPLERNSMKTGQVLHGKPAANLPPEKLVPEGTSVQVDDAGNVCLPPGMATTSNDAKVVLHGGPEIDLPNPSVATHVSASEKPKAGSLEAYGQVIGMQRYVLTFAHFGVYDNPCRHTLFVRKPEGKMHAGLINLPGGKVENGEDPKLAALRELAEETGATGSFPQYMGRLTNGFTYDISIYRCIVASQDYPYQTGSRIHNYKGEQHEVFAVTPSWLNDRKDVVPNLPLLAALCNMPLFNWELRDGAFEYSTMEAEEKEFASFIKDRCFHGRLFMQTGIGMPTIK